MVTRRKLSKKIRSNKSERDKNENAVLSAMTLGMIVGLVVFGIFAICVRRYIEFMNMEYKIYKEFAVYSIFQLYIQLVFSLIYQFITANFIFHKGFVIEKNGTIKRKEKEE